MKKLYINLILVMSIISIILISGCTSQIQEQRKHCIECCESNPEWSSNPESCKEMCRDHIHKEADERGIQSTLDICCGKIDNNSENMKVADNGGSIFQIDDDMIKKYQYPCSNPRMGDHTKHDYVFQSALIEKCQNLCCNGKYCESCQWPEYGDCTSQCEAGLPNGTCVNCDGFCWEKGHLEFLNNAIANCK